MPSCQNVRVRLASAGVRRLAPLLLVTACGGPARDGGPAAPRESADRAQEVSPRSVPPADVVPTPSPAEASGCADADGCFAAAAAAERAGDRARAAGLLDRACDLSSARACFRLGELVRDGAGVPADEARARQLFERGCQHGSTSACDALGH
jgi:TPR repeat protein